MGISTDRLRLEWIPAGEGAKFRGMMNEFINSVRVFVALDLGR